MVQCYGVGAEERWQLAFFHQLLLPECLHKEGFLPSPQNTGGIGELGGHWTFFLLGSQIQILADEDGRDIKAVHCLHSR